MAMKPIKVGVDFTTPENPGVLQIMITVDNKVLEDKVYLTGEEDLAEVIELIVETMEPKIEGFELIPTEDSVIFTPTSPDSGMFIKIMVEFKSKGGSDWDILSEGFEDAVRSLIGEGPDILTDEVLNSKAIAGMAEIIVKQRVPGWGDIVEEAGDKLVILEAAMIYYICYLLAPTMPNRVIFKVKTIELSWEKLRMDWKALAEEYQLLYEEMIGLLSDDGVGAYKIMELAHVIKGDEA